MCDRKQTGFTLVELMVTIAILAVVASIAIPAYNGYIKTGYKSECHNEMASIKLAESEYFLDNNVYFKGNDVGELKTNSGGIYQPSSTALSADTNCTYSVLVSTTNYQITATPVKGSHLDGVAAMTIDGP